MHTRTHARWNSEASEGLGPEQAVARIRQQMASQFVRRVRRVVWRWMLGRHHQKLVWKSRVEFSAFSLQTQLQVSSRLSPSYDYRAIRLYHYSSATLLARSARPSLQLDIILEYLHLLQSVCRTPLPQNSRSTPSYLPHLPATTMAPASFASAAAGSNAGSARTESSGDW